MQRAKPLAATLLLAAAAGCAPVAFSDVSTTDRIGWFCNQDDLRITGLTVATVGQTRFGGFLGAGRGLVRLHVIGTLQDDDGLPPYISQVQVSEQFESPTARAGDLVAVLTVTPVADEHVLFQPGPYDRHVGPVPFDVKVERVVEMYQWGPNVFKFRCGPFERSVSFRQSM